MDDNEWMVERFGEHRAHLRAVAYRMLGSLSEAEDAVQEAWLRLSRADTSEVENLRGWLTTVVARVCLNMLRSRRRGARNPSRLMSLIRSWVSSTAPTPKSRRSSPIPWGLALLVVLDTLPPAERLAFVLHDMFAVPFDEIAPIVGRSTTATRQLASRARRRVQGEARVPDADMERQRTVVDAFFAAAYDGDFEALVSVLDPDVVLRSDRGVEGSVLLRGAAAVAGQALMFPGPSRKAWPAVVNGAAGVVVTVDGRPVSVMAFTVSDGRVVAIDALGDPERLRALDIDGITDEA